MRVGLIAVDGKYPNLALMKLSAWHKAQGHHVSLYTPVEAAIEPFDKVYASKIFTFTPDYAYMPEGAILGGTGYGDPVQLPDEVEHMTPDYSLYGIDYSLGFTSRGCSRKCSFCVVPQKEGSIREHSTLSEFVRHRTVFLQDNNFLASPKAEDKMLEMIEKKLDVDFNQGLDIRLMTARFADLLARLKPKKLRFAWDCVSLEGKFRKGIELLKNAGYRVNRHNVMTYVLCNYDTEFKQDMYRINILRSLDITPFVMVYNKKTAPRYLREFASWCNQPVLFHRYKKFDDFLLVRSKGTINFPV